ncbi:uncharacterized protein LOC129597870 [Paramacrobiotus metropolitanus]|uniref:uncharacterized protein LOC129597870 n=1 Tax=Paramacrobiotus metropolitanus TaxID=2943436 RepID=UPI0024462B28|nr:uncharacterized protein LOC129597870 [Paramacrobiotus metropolitanus]
MNSSMPTTGAVSVLYLLFCGHLLVCDAWGTVAGGVGLGILTALSGSGSGNGGGGGGSNTNIAHGGFGQGGQGGSVYIDMSGRSSSGSSGFDRRSHGRRKRAACRGFLSHCTSNAQCCSRRCGTLSNRNNPVADLRVGRVT